jgi:hypothetical protein
VNPIPPRLDALPAAQRELWPRLAAIPNHFVLCGGTALALRIGHRTFENFDFFSSRAFQPGEVVEAVPFLARGERLQSRTNTLTVSLGGAAPVELSFFGGLSIGRVEEPSSAAGTGLCVASLLDLAATKMAVVQQRAEKRDYLDIAALIRAGISLRRALGAAAALYGEQFNAAITLKALTYFADGDLPALPPTTQQFLAEEAASVSDIPHVPRVSDRVSPRDESAV